MKPGRELDKKVLDILGWTFNKSSFEQYEPSTWSKGSDTVTGTHLYVSSNLSVAMRIVWPWLCGQYYRKETVTLSSGGCWFCGNGDSYISGESEEHALCLAVLHKHSADNTDLSSKGEK